MRRIKRNLLAALAMCGAALIFSPSTVFAQGNVSFEIQRAETLIAQGDYVEALATVRSAISKAPSDYRVRYYSGMALLGLQRFDEARTETELALSLAPEADKAGVQRLLDTIALQSVSLTAEADAEAALAAGLNGRAARLFAQAFNADSSKTEAGFRAATVYAGPLSQPIEAVKVLRKLEQQTARPEARTRAANEIKKLEPAYTPLVVALVEQASSLIFAGNVSEAAARLSEAAVLDPGRREVIIEQLRLTALGNDGRALEAQLLDLSRSGISIDSVIRLLPRGKYWAEQSWLIQLLEDYKGAEYARGIASYLKTVFKDCSACPTMVALPSGNFTMGSPLSETGRERGEGPQRSVNIGYKLAVGRYEVTFEEWDACAADGGCASYKPDDWGWGRGSQPVIMVSWNDAQRYVAWLNQKTGLTGRSDRYRLLTKAEWEYAARAGSQARWSHGDDESRLGNYAWYGSNSGGRTHPVGSKAANGFGLHDMHGNVAEWVEDCHEARYSTQPSDGSAFTKSSCPSRVSRGGSWTNPPQVLRSAGRDWNSPAFGGPALGFRVARTLP